MAFGNDLSAPTTYVSQDNADAILKELYSDDGLTDELYKDNPFLAMVPKKEDVTGRFFNQPIWAAAGQAQSAVFTNLQTFSGLSGEALFDFQVQKYENHAVANISNKLIAESSSTKGAFVDMVRLIADGQMQQFLNDLAKKVYRGLDGNMGQVGGSVAGTLLTFANPADAVNFELGEFLDFAATNTGTTVRALASNNTSCQITSIDQVGGTAVVKWNGTGTQTLTANNVVVGDFIYRSGDKGLGLNGFTDWIPYGGVTSTDSFLSVNRSVHAQKLAGNYLNGTGGNLEEILEKALNQVARLGGKIKQIFMPYGQYTALANSQGAKVQLVNVKADTGMGFEGLEVIGANSRVVIHPDRSIPSNLIAGVDIGTWKVISVGKMCHLWQEDGKVWLRSYNQAGMEIRFYSLANVVCREPRSQINILCNPLV